MNWLKRISQTRAERAFEREVDAVFKAFTLVGPATPMGGFGSGPAGMISGLMRGSEITASSVLALAFSWLSLNVVEPELQLFGPDGKKVEDPEARDLALFPFTRVMSMSRHIQFAAESLKADGNAWWLLKRDKNGVLQEITPVPRNALSVERDGSKIRRIRVTIGGKHEERNYEDFLHLALGIDPDCPVLGLSPLKASLRHVLSDEEWAASSELLAQRAGMGIDVISPNAGSDISPGKTWDADAVAKMKAKIRDALRGSDRLTPLVLGQPVTAQAVGVFASGIEKIMVLPAIRCAAAFGVSYSTLNLPSVGGTILSGTDKAASQRVDTENCLVPLWEVIARGLTEKAGPFLPGLFTQGSASFVFDLTQVKALQSAISENADWVMAAYEKGLMTQNEARQRLNLAEVDGGSEFAIPSGVASVQRGRMEVLQAINAGHVQHSTAE